LTIRGEWVETDLKEGGLTPQT